MNNSLFLSIIALLAIISLAVVTPFIFIWSVNTLFTLGIPYTFSTWGASLILIILLGPSTHFTGKK